MSVLTEHSAPLLGSARHSDPLTCGVRGVTRVRSKTDRLTTHAAARERGGVEGYEAGWRGMDGMVGMDGVEEVDGMDGMDWMDGVDGVDGMGG